MLQTQDRLAQLDLKNQKAGYLPKVFLTSTYGYSTGRPQFGDLITKPWFNAATVGFSIQVPIFDGFAKNTKLFKLLIVYRRSKKTLTSCKTVLTYR
jgi:outer membrane protein TolC